MSSGDERWEALLARQDQFTCYSAAMATWLAVGDADWATPINPGLWLALTEEPAGLLGFGYFPPGLRSQLGLTRAGAEDPEAALGGVCDELARSGRVIVAGDGYHLPWHVAHGREHLPHWFTVTGTPDRPAIADPFACRNELGIQTPEHRVVDAAHLRGLLPALPATNPVHRLREELAFGERCEIGLAHRHQWFTYGGGAAGDEEPAGHLGPAAIERLAAHFRAHGQDLAAAYTQADDIWSIARHRAFLVTEAQARGTEDWDGWVAEHGTPLARRWGHVAPLLMQAVLSLRAGRAASSSVPDALAELAAREAAAAHALPDHEARFRISVDRARD